jgi:hypothetical protein
MTTKVSGNLPDSVAIDLEDWANQQGRSLSSLVSFLLENAVFSAKMNGTFKPTYTPTPSNPAKSK